MALMRCPSRISSLAKTTSANRSRGTLSLLPTIHEFHSSTCRHSDWTSLGTSLVDTVEDVIVTAQLATGCPSWLTVVGITLGFRAIATLPVTLYQQHKSAKLELLAPRIRAWGTAIAQRNIASAKPKGLADEDVQALINRELTAKREELIASEGCQRWKFFLPAIVQLPVWVSISLALRRAEDAASSMHTAIQANDPSWLWMTDMTQPDIFVFPILLGACNILSLELGGVGRPPPSATQRNLTQAFRYIGVIMVPIAANVPAILSWYWSCSSMLALGQSLLLRYPPTRRVLGLPQVPSELEQPLSASWSHVCNNTVAFWREVQAKNFANDTSEADSKSKS
eukprot:TRINITY_DN8245_c0_g1_i1.p1 TRINITY_DN8245_c0_g1~~TRINITY_DN8245_c0_g1_i1.p1  ORF type:complete len:359 (+),score=42.00 TRINITY_DN8245_c0_g1_i1:58-1077(+)